MVEQLQQNEPVKSVSLLIPMYNEHDVLVPLLKRIIPVLWKLRKRWRVQLIVVDDGSTDGTGAYVDKHFSKLLWTDVVIIHHEHNQGLGAAMASGFAAAEGDAVCTLDADCTYSPEKLEAMVDFLINEKADIVTASPYHPDARRPSARFGRILLSKAASSFYGWLAPAHLYCYTSFFRVYRRAWARTAFFESDGFLAVTEVLVNALYAGAKVREFPLCLGDRAFGQSKMHLLHSIENHLRLMTKMASLRFQFRRDLKEHSLAARP